MIVTFTPEERAKINALESKYEKLIADCEAEIESLRSDDLDPDGSIEAAINAKRLPEPTHLKPKPIEYTKKDEPIYSSEELQAYYDTPEYQAYKEANAAANDEISRLYDEWEAKGSEAWREARTRHLALIDELNQARKQLYSECERRQFAELNGDPDKIIEDVKSQMALMIKNRYENAKAQQAKGDVFSVYYLRVDGDKFYIDSETLIEDSTSLLKLHYDFFKNDPKKTKEIRAIVLDIIANSPYAGSKGRLGAYINERLRSKAPYRTREKARQEGAIVEAPKTMPIVTLQNYQYSMSLYQSGGAYLQPLSSTDGLKFKNGKMYFDGAKMKEVSEVELQNMKTKEGIENIDLSTLRIFYSIILTQFETTNCSALQDVLTMSVPTLAEFIGLQSNLNKKDIARVIEKTQSYHNVIGVLHGTRNGKPVQSLYPVLNFEGYNDKTNTISFSSPYMNYVIKTVYNLSVRKTKDGKKKLKKNGEPLRLPSHSYLIDSSIAKERNKAAVENVILIVQGIEQAGGKSYHIAASTLVERNIQLAERLQNDPQHRAQLLKRVFTKTWELLRTKTRLAEAYKDIELPDPKDPAYIPTVKGLSSMVFEIKHNGKK